MLRTPSWEKVDEGRLRSPHAVAVRSWLGCDLSIKLNQSLQVSHISDLLGTRDSSFGNKCPSVFCDFSPCCREGFPSQEAGKLSMVMRGTGFFPIPCSAICHSSVVAV